MAAATASDRCSISDLPATCDEAQTKAVFGAYGTIKSCIFMAQKRAAIIQFESAEEAKWVVDNLNGNIAQGLSTPCKVEFAQANAAKGAAKGAWSAGAAGGWGAAQEKGGAAAQRSSPYGGKAVGYGKPALGDAGEQQKGGSWGPQKGSWGQEAQKGGAWSSKGGKDEGWGQKGSWSAGKGGEQQKGGWSDKGSWSDKGGKGYGGGKKGGGAKGLKKGLQEAGVLPGGKWSNDENALFVGGLPSDMTDLDLYAIFSPFGAIPYRGVRAMTHQDGMGKGTCKGFGFVNFISNDSAVQAISTLNGLEPSEGCTLQVMVKAPAGPVAKDESKGEAKGESKGKGKGKW